jgi:predicted transposase YbfD/YdcC
LSKKTVETIINSRNDYFIQVKKNQKILFQKIQTVFDQEIALQHSSNQAAFKKEFNKGRSETRVCYKTDFEDQDWKGLKTVVLIISIVKQKLRNKITSTTITQESMKQSYFISSQKESAEYYLNLKRSHWSIEAFHYIKDITYKEDTTRTNKANSPQNHSHLRSLAISIYKSIGSTNQAQSIRLFANKIPELYNMIQSF